MSSHGALPKIPCGRGRAQHGNFCCGSRERVRLRQPEPDYGRRSQLVRRDGADFLVPGLHPFPGRFAEPAAHRQPVQFAWSDCDQLPSGLAGRGAVFAPRCHPRGDPDRGRDRCGRGKLGGGMVAVGAGA